MGQKTKLFLSIISLTIIFNFFFWDEKIGLNIFLFILLLSICNYIINSNSERNKGIILSFSAVLYSGVMVVYNNSAFSKLGLIVSCIVLTGFVHQPQLRTIISSVFTAIGSFTMFPVNTLDTINDAIDRHKEVARLFKIFRLSVIPIAVFLMFYGIYAYSNPVFNSYSNSFWDFIGKYLHEIFINYPAERFIFLLFGLFLITGVIYKRNIKVFLKIDLSYLNNLIRDKYRKLITRSDEQHEIGKGIKRYIHYKTTSLLTEYRIGILLIIMVNLILLIYNIIDISFLWFGFETLQVENLAYFVHEGTYYLIFSIILSMAILLYFFRGNLNFYSRNKILKFGAFFWILQNAVMSISVAIRNYYYIEYYYALSYKRIGVIIFLVLTFTGLITMIIKIYSKKTLFFLIKVNSLAVFIVMLIIGSFNWDKNIASFNLQNPDKNRIDLEFLLKLSDAALPVLYENKMLFEKEVRLSDGLRIKYVNGLEELEERRHNFEEDQKLHSCLSWNYSDFVVRGYFESNNAKYVPERKME